MIKRIGKLQELTSLNQLNEIFVCKISLKEVPDSALGEVVRFLNAQAGLLGLLDENKEMLIVNSIYNINKERLEFIKQKWIGIPLAICPIKVVLEKKDITVIKLKEIENDFREWSQINDGLESRMIVCVPLWSKANINGVIIFYFSEERELSEEEKKMFLKVGDRMMAVIEKANLFRQMERRIEQFSALYKISHSISGKLDIEEILANSLPFLSSMFEAEKAWVMLCEDEKLIASNPCIGLEAAEKAFLRQLNKEKIEISQAILASGQVLIFNNPFHINSFSIALGIGVDNILLIPLKMQSHPIGIIYVANSKKGKFTLTDSQLATSVGIQLAGALESVRLHRRLAEENMKLGIANRLKSQFLANMSHELRTPMNSIIGYTHCLLNGMDGEINQEQRQDLERVLNSAENLLQLINDILDISKIEAGKMEIRLEHFNLLKCINNTLVILEDLAINKGLQIFKELPQVLPTVLGDPSRVRQILINLLSNAIKFTDEGCIILRVNNNDIFVEIEIEDTGVGIAEHDLPYIFDEFRQVDGSSTRKHGGTGLGLAITKKLVELQCGRVWVESELGKGSKFTFTLPTELSGLEKEANKTKEEINFQ